MFTKTQLKEFMEKISEEAIFATFEYRSSERFQVLIKCKINDNETTDYSGYVKNWMNRFSAFTNTAWVVGAYPRVPDFLYRKMYTCPRSAQDKSRTAPRSLNPLCKAKISFNVKAINSNTLNNDPYLQMGLNMDISVDFTHSHLVRDRDSLNLLSSLSDCHSVFFEYFADGYFPVTAKFYHQLWLQGKYGMDSEELDNSNLNPKTQSIQYLHKRKWIPTPINVNDVLRRKVETLEKLGYTARYNADAGPFVVIVTPLMKRVISQVSVRQVLVDATLRPGAPFTLFLYVPSMIGSLPVACVVFIEETEAIYDQIFLTIKQAIESDCDINFSPELLLHDDFPEIRKALLKVFPNSLTKLNRYSLCRDIWRWICSDKRDQISMSNQILMSLFNDMIYAKSVALALPFYNIISCTTVGTTWHNKVKEVWKVHRQWLDGTGLSDGFNSAPIAFLKEFILQLCQPFNGFLPAMVDIVSNVIEPHYHKILQSHIDGDVKSVYTKFIAKIRIDDNSDILTAQGPNEYSIRDQLNPKWLHQLNTRTMCCTCGVGQIGRMCGHLCGVLTSIDNTLKFVLYSSLNENDKGAFLKILDSDVIVIKYENEQDLLEIEAVAIDEAMLSDESYEIKIKQEDTLEEKHEDGAEITFASEAEEATREQYEAGIQALDEEFRRLNKLFKENPNRTNLYTMQRLAKELAKIVVVQEADMSNMTVATHSTNESGES